MKVVPFEIPIACNGFDSVMTQDIPLVREWGLLDATTKDRMHCIYFPNA